MKTPDQVLTEWASDEITFDLGQGPVIVTKEEMILIADAIWTGQLNVPKWEYYGTYFSNRWDVGMVRKCMGQKATGQWLAQFETITAAAIFAIFDGDGKPSKFYSFPTFKELEASGEL